LIDVISKQLALFDLCADFFKRIDLYGVKDRGDLSRTQIEQMYINWAVSWDYDQIKKQIKQTNLNKKQSD